MQVKYFSFKNLKLVVPQSGDEYVIHIYVDFTGCFKSPQGHTAPTVSVCLCVQVQSFSTLVITSAENGPHAFNRDGILVKVTKDEKGHKCHFLHGDSETSGSIL
jgi:hypothetical protein